MFTSTKNPRKSNYRCLRTLCNFARSNNIEGVKALLGKGADVNSKEGGYKAPIHLAAEHGNIEVLKLLVEAGADVNIRTFNDWTPLFFANDPEVAKILVQAGADLDAKDNSSRNALSMAVRNNKLSVVQFLVESCGFEVDTKSCSGFTPLHAACNIIFCKGGFNIQIVKFLLRKNAKIDNVVHGSYLYRGHTPIVTFLLKSRSVNASNYSITEYIQFLKFLLKYSDLKNLNFGTFRNYVRILDKNTCLIFLEHVSVLISLGIFIHSHENFISESQDYKDHFDECQNELVIAKGLKFRNSWITFFNILTDSNKKLKNYAGNEVLMNDFNSTDFTNKFPIYGTWMQEKMKKAIKIRELYDRSCILLSGLLPIFNPNHLIVRDTIDCVTSTKDLSKFC